MSSGRTLRVAVLGAGLIGVDLVAKIQESSFLRCDLVSSRNGEAQGMRALAEMGCQTSAGGVAALLECTEPYDIVFDATSAMASEEHWKQLKPVGAALVDLTPSASGRLVVPSLMMTGVTPGERLCLISCAGQATVPLVADLSKYWHPNYVEVVATVASRSVGRASRMNVDEYVETTELAIKALGGADEVKVMVNLSPAKPAATFRVAISMITEDPVDEGDLKRVVDEVSTHMRELVPGYRIANCSTTDERIFVSVEVLATGRRLPRAAGNIDITNSVAIRVAEKLALSTEPIGESRI